MTRVPLLRPRTVEAAKALVHDFLVTGRKPDWARECEKTDIEIDLDLVKTLLRNGMERFDWRKIDAFVAPRLHCVLRLPRDMAFDRRMWTWLAIECDDYVRFRHDPPASPESREDAEEEAGIHPWRYDGEFLRNAMSRLWWGAEFVHNGRSYADVQHVFRSVKTAEYALELLYSWHRPAAISFTRVAAGLDGGAALGERHMKELSKRLRVQLSLHAAEASGLDQSDDETMEFDAAWAVHQPAWADVRSDDITQIEGPATGVAAAEAIAELTAWFRRIADGIGAAAHQAA